MRKRLAIWRHLLSSRYDALKMRFYLRVMRIGNFLLKWGGRRAFPNNAKYTGYQPRHRRTGLRHSVRRSRR